MQVILLQYPGIEGEAMLSGYEGLIAIDNMSIKGGSGSTDKPAKLGDDANASECDVQDSKNAQTNNRQKSPSSSTTKSASSSSSDKKEDEKKIGFDSIDISRKADKATPKFFAEAYRPKTGKGVTVKVVVFRAHQRENSGGMTLSLDLKKGLTTSGNATNWHEPYIILTMENAKVTGHNLTIGGDGVSETVTLGFEKMKMEYIVYRNGKKCGSVIGEVDLTNPDNKKGSAAGGGGSLISFGF